MWNLQWAAAASLAHKVFPRLSTKMFSFLGVKTFNVCARNVFTKPDINYFSIKTKYLTPITITKQYVNNRKK